MKHKKTLVIIGIIVLILFAVVSLLTVSYHNAHFTIPDNYLQKFENHMSYVDGPDVDYYIYKDKIIVDEQSYYPLGHSITHERTITLYDNLEINETNLKNYLTIIKDRKGKVVLHIQE